MIRLLVITLLALVVTIPSEAQVGRRGRRGRTPVDVSPNNVPYGNQFTFVRLQYTMSRYVGFREPPWAHDYPRAERNFAKILSEISYVRPYMGGGNILRLDDPELFKFPMAYLSEPGFWSMNQAEVDGLRSYLLRGGFLIIDDFGDDFGNEWFNFESQMRLAFPDVQVHRVDPKHPIFNSFFSIDIETLYLPSYRGNAQFYGVFEDNDPTKRLMVIVNYLTDIGEFWEFSDTGFIPIDLSNEAYKLGVNYLVYAMMH